MAVRTFKLTNGKGTEWKFTDKSFTYKSFLGSPKGLGLNDTIVGVRYGSKMVETSRSENFPSITGTISFYDVSNSSRYEQYNKFIEFLSYRPLYLTYGVPKTTFSEYTVDCAVSVLSKTESTTAKSLDCDITITGMSFFKGAEVTTTGSSASYSLTNNGHMPVGFVIGLVGSGLTNPYFTLEQDSEIYGEGKFLGSFDKVTVDSNDGEQNVVLESGGSVLPNPLSYQDLSISNGAIYVTFVKLARGTSTLTIGQDSGTLTSASISYTPIYRSV